MGADGVVYLQGGSQGLVYDEDPPARARALDLGDMSLHELPMPPEKGAHGALMVSDGRLVMFGGSGDDLVINQAVLSLPLYESSAELGATSAGPGTSVRVNISAELFFVGDLSITATAHLMKGSVSYGSCSLSTPSGGFATGLLDIPEDAAPGMYEVVITDAHLGVGVEDMQEQLDALQEGLDSTREELKEAVDAKLDAIIGYVIMILVIVTLVVGVIVLVRKK
jgi:hypothetical protein